MRTVRFLVPLFIFALSSPVHAARRWDHFYHRSPRVVHPHQTIHIAGIRSEHLQHVSLKGHTLQRARGPQNGGRKL